MTARHRASDDLRARIEPRPLRVPYLSPVRNLGRPIAQAKAVARPPTGFRTMKTVVACDECGAWFNVRPDRPAPRYCYDHRRPTDRQRRAERRPAYNWSRI